MRRGDIEEMTLWAAFNHVSLPFATVKQNAMKAQIDQTEADVQKTTQAQLDEVTATFSTWSARSACKLTHACLLCHNVSALLCRLHTPNIPMCEEQRSDISDSSSRHTCFQCVRFSF